MVGYIKYKKENSELYEIEDNRLIKLMNKEENEIQDTEKSKKEMKRALKNILYKTVKLYFELVVFIKQILNIITIKQIYNGYIFIFPYKEEKQNKRKIAKSVNKIQKLIEKYKIDTIVLSDEIKKNEMFLELFAKRKAKESRLKLLNGRGLFPYMIYEIVEFILKLQNKKTELEDIYILVNGDKKIYIDNILYLIHHFKTVNIVTNNIRRFKQLEERIYEKEAIPITVSNNRKKSLKNAKIIINFDFEEQELKRYIIYRKAIIIHVNNSIQDARGDSCFDGIHVHNLDIDASKELKEFFDQYNLLNECSLSVLYESLINRKASLSDVRKNMQDDHVQVLNLY